MKIQIKQKNINSIIRFLDQLVVKGQASLGRSKLKEKLSTALDIYARDEALIVEEYAEYTDSNHTRFDWKDGCAGFGQEQLKELGNNEVEVSLADYSKWFAALKQKVLNYDEEISGVEADGWAILVEQFDDEDTRGGE